MKNSVKKTLLEYGELLRNLRFKPKRVGMDGL